MEYVKEVARAAFVTDYNLRQLRMNPLVKFNKNAFAFCLSLEVLAKGEDGWSEKIAACHPPPTL
jgi:hypothetical protein